MHAVIEAKSILEKLPRWHAEPKWKWLGRVGGFFGLTYSQAKKIYYGEVKGIDADRLDFMREKLNELQEGAGKRREILNDIAIGIATARADLRGTSAGSGASLGDRPGEGPGRTGRDGSGTGSLQEDWTPAAPVRPSGQ